MCVVRVDIVLDIIPVSTMAMCPAWNLQLMQQCILNKHAGWLMMVIVDVIWCGMYTTII